MLRGLVRGSNGARELALCNFQAVRSRREQWEPGTMFDPRNVRRIEFSAVDYTYGSAGLARRMNIHNECGILR